LLLAAVATGSVAMPAKDPLPSCGSAEQAGPNGSAAMSLEDEELDEDELDDEEGIVEEDESPPAVSLLELPQAARPSGRARVSAAIVLRRARRMVSPWWMSLGHSQFGAGRRLDCQRAGSVSRC
jgi:hypothetical protein